MIAKIRDNYGDNFDQMMIPKKQNAGLAILGACTLVTKKPYSVSTTGILYCGEWE